MKMLRNSGVRAALLTTGMALIVFVGCQRSSNPNPGKIGSIKIDGSSTVEPLSSAMAEEFMKENPGVKITVGESGTGGGFQKFIRKETDISDASRPILQKEIQAAKAEGVGYIELPVAFDALTVVIHPENSWANSMTVEDLKKIWEPEAQGKITHWNQVRSEWPNEKLDLYGAGTASGTFDYFTEAIVGKAKSSRADYTPSENDNVLVQGVAGNKYSLGYFGYSYYVSNANKVKAVAIQWDKGKVQEAIAPSDETVLNGTYQPLSRPLFIYVNKNSAERPEVKEFVEFYLKKTPELAKETGFVALPAKAYEVGLERLHKQQTGTGFGGVPEVGLQIEDLLKREPK